MKKLVALSFLVSVFQTEAFMPADELFIKAARCIYDSINPKKRKHRVIVTIFQIISKKNIFLLPF